MSVAPQIAPDDMAEIVAAGFTALINNRPDGEEAGQPTGDAIRAAAEAAGLAYTAIPVAGGMSVDQLDAMRAALDTDGRALAFCRSGTRSCHLWALARAQSGEDPAGLAAKARDAGYDLSPLRPTLDVLAGRR